MSINRFGHLDLRVAEMKVALTFYEELLPRLGFTVRSFSEQWKVFAGEGELPSMPFIALTEDPDHHPNRNRVAFWVASRQDVDELAILIRRYGGRNVSGPRECSEYSPTYYAVFFEDPCGNCLEVVHRTN